ncbi:hypothetical protein SEPCBS57363_004386 [Sporothrix epigloea]|uniref:Uncharacterized protein n=1 Tax=Sporothrix epigloea TaxID=1892477 RepID=A0ABP0DVT2_9PEZI
MPCRKPNLVLATPAAGLSPIKAPMSAGSKRTSNAILSSTWREAMGLASAGLPSAGLSSAGLSSAGFTFSGFPSAGLPSAGLHSAGLLSTGPYSPLVAIKSEESLLKAPLSPAVAYIDFLKVASPVAGPDISTLALPTTFAASDPAKQSSLTSTTKRAALTKTRSSIKDTETEFTFGSGPFSAALVPSSNALKLRAYDHGHRHRHKQVRKSPKIARIDTTITTGPNAGSFCPMSAPPMGRTMSFDLSVPASPIVSDSKVLVQSPFSAKPAGVTSAFDWESALKARYAEFKSPKSPPPARLPGPASQNSCKDRIPAAAATKSFAPTASSLSTSVTAARNAAKTSMRHIREVVTRTVTYKPRMEPLCLIAAPKGKKRKIGCDKTA